MPQSTPAAAAAYISHRPLLPLSWQESTLTLASGVGDGLLVRVAPASPRTSSSSIGVPRHGTDTSSGVRGRRANSTTCPRPTSRRPTGWSVSCRAHSGSSYEVPETPPLCSLRAACLPGQRLDGRTRRDILKHPGSSTTQKSVSLGVSATRDAEAGGGDGYRTVPRIVICECKHFRKHTASMNTERVGISAKDCHK